MVPSVTAADLARRSVLIALSSVLSPVAAWAQDRTSRVEVGGQVVVAGITASRQAPGFGGTIDVNLSRQLALEFRLSRVSEVSLGPATHFATGVRATFVQTPRFGLYGMALPGLNHLGASPYLPPGSHFVLDLGAGLAFSLTPRLVARIEVDRDLHAWPGTVVSFNDGTEQFVIPSRIWSRWNLHAGASYRLGSTLGRPADRPAAGRWSMGPQLGYTVATSEVGIGSVGMFASYRLSAHCDLDMNASTDLRDTLPSTIYEGGGVMQGLAGVRLGVRAGRFGVFFKARAGANSYSKVFRTDPTPRLRRSTVAVLDIGGIVETYLSRRAVIRVDIGETLSFAPGVTIVFPPLFPGYEEFPQHAPGAKIYSLPIRVGFGWRF